MPDKSVLRHQCLSFSSLFFLVFALVVLVSRPLVGRLFDSRGVRAIIIPALLCLALGMLVFSQTQNQPMLLGSAAIIGLGVGAVQSATLSEVGRITAPARRGVASTTYFLFCDIGYCLGPLLIGVCLPFLGYRGVFAILALVTALNLAYFSIYTARRAKRAVR